MAGKEEWPKPAAWAITQNERLWEHFDSVADRSVVISWSLGDSYRTDEMQPGDRALFWVTGKNGGLARLGFVLSTSRTPGGTWTDAFGVAHEAPYSGTFYLPPFPNRRYIHRSAFADRAALANCELLTTAAQRPAPLRIEAKEWKEIEKILLRFDRSSPAFRAGWEG